MTDISEEAIRNYTGADGRVRRNCARAVSDACASDLPLDFPHATRLSSSGGGRAPGGVCGALHAAQLVAEKYYPQAVAEVAAQFELLSGSLYCREIRSEGRVPCMQCVGNAGRIIDNLKKGVRNGA